MSEPESCLLDTSAVIDLPSPPQITSDAEYLPLHRADRLARLQWVSDTFDPLPFTRPGLDTAIWMLVAA